MRHSPVGRAVALVIGQPDPNPGVPWAVPIAPPGYVVVHPWFPELNESFRPSLIVSDNGRYSPSPEPLTVQKVKDIVAEMRRMPQAPTVVVDGVLHYIIPPS